MSSIPLPALDVRPPSPSPNVLEQYGQLMQIKNQQAMQPLQQQAAQQQVQQGGLELQQRQQDLKDQQGISKWFMGIDPSDPNAFDPIKVGKTLAQSGVSGKGIMAAQQQLMQHQQTVLTMTKDQLANQQELSNNVYNGINGVIGVTDPQQRAQLMTPLIQTAVQAKAIQPQQAQQMMQNPAAITDDQLKSMQHGLGVSSAFLASVARMQTAQTGAQTAGIKAPGEQATSDSLVLKNAAQQLAASPDQATYQAALGELPMKIAKNFPQQFDQQKILQAGMTPAEVVTSQATASQRNETNSFRQQTLGLEAQRTALQQQQMGIGTNGQPSDLAQAIASGHIPLDRMGYLLARNPALISGVMQIDPSFDGSKAQSYPATYKDFTSGKTSIAINSGGTALSHLNELQQMNTVESHIPGTPDYNAYQNKADTVASELAKFYGDATIPAIDAIKKTLTAQLPGNRKAAIQTQAQSMGDKLDSFQQQWQNAAPSKAYEAPMPGISPQAMAARAALDPQYKASGASQPKVGEVKVFPNGKKGTWDGTGYVAQ